jgi:hypothetical protein
LGQIYWQAVLSCALHPSHFSVITKLGMVSYGLRSHKHN